MSLVLLEAGTGTVIGMGMGIVFFGLICLIFLIMLMGVILRPFTKKEEEKKAAEKAAADAERARKAAAASSSASIPNRGEFVAAVSAAIAEELETDVSKIRIDSIKRL